MALSSFKLFLCRKLWNFNKTFTQHSIRYSSSGGLSYYHNIGKEPFKYITVGKLLEEAAEKWPDRKALISFHENLDLSFSQILTESDRLASGFLKLGLKPGDRLGMIGPNNHNWYTIFTAAAKAGLILVNINPAFQAEEILHCLKSANINGLICEESYKTQMYYKMLTDIIPEVQSSPSSTFIKSNSLPNFTTLIVNTETNLPGAWRLNDIPTDVTDSFRKVEKLIQPDDPCNIQYSSGSTGLPKPVLLNHFTMVNNCNIFGRSQGFNKRHHSICLQVPFFHSFGLVGGVVCGINYGCTLVLPSPGFNSLDTIEALKKIRCSVIYGTPTMYVDLCNKIKDANDEELKKNLNIEIAVSGGALCLPNLSKVIADTLKSSITVAYGMTETSPIVMITKPGGPLDEGKAIVGQVAESLEVKVVDNNGKMVPFGTPGEAWFRGYTSMLGYYQNQQATNDTITPCRWIKSGDLMKLDENGFGEVIGRKKDVIIRGGENIFPAEIENFLEKHTNILEAQVFGVADTRMGEEVFAAVKLKSKANLQPDEIQKFCKGKISHFKIPRYIKIVENFPKTASGKVQKYKLKQEMEEQLKMQNSST